MTGDQVKKLVSNPYEFLFIFLHTSESKQLHYANITRRFGGAVSIAIYEIDRRNVCRRLQDFTGSKI